MVAATRPQGFVRASRALQDYDFTPDLAGLRCKTAFIVGAGDGVLPSVMRGAADRVAGASYIVVDGAGHLPNVEQPDRFNAALERFLCDTPLNNEGT
jgi:pimeloyl-ACP methyl ester carboxylesterase